MKTFIVTLFLIIVCVSCKKGPTQKNDFPNPGVAIHYEDSNGNDLFSDGANGYIKNNVRTYTLINGIRSLDTFTNSLGKTVYNPTTFVNVFNDEIGDSVMVGAFGLPINKIDYKKLHYFTTLIVLKEGVQDTMRTYINGSKSIDSLWYNGKLLYTNPYFPQLYDMRKIITVEKEN